MESLILSSREHIDSIISLGDAIYPNDEKTPTAEEEEALMKLYSDRQSLGKLPIHHIRGNHDLTFEFA